MKPFKSYQHIPGTKMTVRDKAEVGSKFWNKGKWDNFVDPLLPEDCTDMTFIDMGCNAGLFLKLAQEKGFDKVIGVDSDKEAIERGIEWRDKIGYKYDLQHRKMERSIDKLPVADYTVFANAHYYFDIDDWLDYVDRLMSKTRYCIIVTDESRRNLLHKTSASVSGVKDYFQSWKYEKEITTSFKEDPRPRELCGLLFKSPLIQRVQIDSLDNGNHQQDGFYRQIDEGVKWSRTDYYRRMKSYRLKEHNWNRERLDSFMKKKASLYSSIKKVGLMKPITVNSQNRIVDGNHRCAMFKHFGHKSILTRRVL